MKIVIYTAISGSYDCLLPPTCLSKNCDYVCFADNPCVKSDVWKVVPFPDNSLDAVRKCRYVKICPHLFFPEYDYSVWVDANVDMHQDIEAFLGGNFPTINCFKHPVRNCIYKEARICTKIKKDSPSLIGKQIETYKKAGFPSNFGLIESNVLLRAHNHPACINVMEAWWQEVKAYSRRDQISFNYAIWKTGASYHLMVGNARNGKNPCFTVRAGGHHRCPKDFYDDK